MLVSSIVIEIKILLIDQILEYFVHHSVLTPTLQEDEFSALKDFVMSQGVWKGLAMF
jgi:hypothetical protein